MPNKAVKYNSIGRIFINICQILKLPQVAKIVAMPLVTLWIEKSSMVWHIGYCTKITKRDCRLFCVEHVYHTDCNSDLKWTYPTTNEREAEWSDFGVWSNWEWNLTLRNNVFTLKNHADKQNFPKPCKSEEWRQKKTWHSL